MRTLNFATSVLALAALGGQRVAGAPPLDPLIPQPFSLDAVSPELNSAGVRASDLVERDLIDGTVDVVVSGSGLGLFAPTLDELDAHSTNRSALSATTPFVILFSVDRGTLGKDLPDPNLFASGVVYNVTDQAARRQAAGDIYMSLKTYTLAGGAPFTAGLRGPGGRGNSLVLNQFDEGGTSLTLSPESSSEEKHADPNDDPNSDPNSKEDEVDSSDGVEDPSLPPSAANAVYFSLQVGSPSLSAPGFPGAANPSGAHVFLKVTPGDPGPPILYASRMQLGLVTTDELDGLTVFDHSPVGAFGANDVVLFSLARGSPSLLTITGVSPVGAAADVFIRTNGITKVLASADELGLGALPDRDNIDALDVFVCADGGSCVLQHGIRRRMFDCDDDGEIEWSDAGCFGGGCFLGPGVSYDVNGAITVEVIVTSVLTPRFVHVETGDRVRWLWCNPPAPLHAIRSGRMGFPDGAFQSGPANACQNYLSPAFNRPFMAANPRAAGVYPYFDSQSGAGGAVVVNPHPCQRVDADNDGDGDMRDYAALQQMFGQ